VNAVPHRQLHHFQEHDQLALVAARRTGGDALTRPNETRVHLQIAVAVNAGSRAWQKYLPAKHGIRSIQNDES
jgi:hypothetical protein